MRIAGIIAEYNPFHRGHAWQIQETRRLSGCDSVVICMSGSFTQRGEAACLSKWARARMALLCGADAVFELPALFAVRSADAFARGGVAVLDGLGADVLSFGSEQTDMALLSRLAALRSDEPAGLTEALRANLDLGMGYAKAWGDAAAALLGVDAALLRSPNLILAAEYLRAMRAQGSSMEPLAVLRRGGFHDALDGDGFAPAGAIRQALFGERRADALAQIPEAARGIAADARPMRPPDDLLLWELRNMDAARLGQILDVSEGLERRILAQARVCPDAEALLNAVSGRRYTKARVRRILACALTGLTQAFSDAHPLPHYARLIGMRADAAPLLRELKARARIPIVSDPVALRGDDVFRLECRFTDLRALQCAAADERAAGQEFTQKFVLVA